MSDNDNGADELYAMGQFGQAGQFGTSPTGAGSDKHYVPPVPPFQPSFRVRPMAHSRPVPDVVMDDPDGYQVSDFRGRKGPFGRQPENLMTEPQREVARRTFGPHSAQGILQARELPSGREAYLLPNWQVIQRSSPKEEASNGGKMIFHLRTSYISAQTARMIVDGFESQPGSFVDFSKKESLLIQGNSPFFQSNVRNALRREEARRHGVVHDEMFAWQNKLLSDRVSGLRAGALPIDGAGDRASKAKIDLVSQVDTALKSGKMTSQQMSRVYREFEPWGHSRPKTQEPDWAKLAVITGVRAGPQPSPSPGHNSPQPNEPYRPKPRVRFA